MNISITTWWSNLTNNEKSIIQTHLCKKYSIHTYLDNRYLSNIVLAYKLFHTSVT